MTGFTPWKSQGLTGIAVIEAQRCWLSDLAETLRARLQLNSSQEAIGECLQRLMSGLLQSLVSEEEACLELGAPVDELHLAEHNELCLQVLDLTHRHERDEQIGLHLLQLLHDWLGRHCEHNDRVVLH